MRYARGRLPCFRLLFPLRLFCFTDVACTQLALAVHALLPPLPLAVERGGDSAVLDRGCGNGAKDADSQDPRGSRMEAEVTNFSKEMEGDGWLRDRLGFIKDECLCLRNHILADPALQVGLLGGDVRVRVDLTARKRARDTPCTQAHDQEH